MRLTTAAQALTGHMIVCPEAHCVTVSFRSSFFCISNVIEMLSEYSSLGSVRRSIMPSLRNLRFRKHSIAVRLISACGTLTYSQDLQAK
jgi:hypothetical protein